MTSYRMPKPFTREELAALKGTPCRDDVRAVETFLHETGMRSAEALSITDVEAMSWVERWRWSRKPPPTVKIIGKGDKERIVLLTPRAVRAAHVLVASINSVDRYGYMIAFGDRRMRELLKRHGEEAGVHCHPHRYRHTWITEHVEAGTDINVVADMAGHSSVDMTRRYYAASVRARAAAEKRRRRAR